MLHTGLSPCSRALLVLGAGLFLAPPLPLAADGMLPVRVTIAEMTETSLHPSLTGEIAARDTVSAAFPTGGRISELLVDVGDKVAAGAVLARIERVQQEQDLRSAKAQLAAAEAEYAAASDANDRQNALLERGATTRASRDAASDRLAVAAAGRAQTEAGLTQAEDALDDTVLYASTDATVTSRLAEPGQVVGAAQPIVELALGQGYEAVFDVPESQLIQQSGVNAPVDITLTPLDRTSPTVIGHVREISPLVEATTGTVEVKVTLEEPLAGLTYGDPVRGTTVLSEGANISLPWSAISATVDGPAVWIVDPATNQVSLRQVELQRYASDAILIASGVEPGEMVVTLGTQLLYPGRVIQPLEDNN